MIDFVPLVGPALGGASWTPRDLEPATIARPVWGPLAFMIDLEVRLGLAPMRSDPVARLVAIRERAEAASPDAFFARSLAVDPWGTARELGRMIDTVLDAGWDTLPPAGHRVAALAALIPDLPPADAERLARLERALASGSERRDPLPYRAIELAAPPAHWSGRWRRILDHLATRGVRVDQAKPARVEAPGDLGHDLGRIRCLLAGGRPEPLVGDGSFLVVHAATPEPLADAVAALVAADPAARTVVLRTGDAGPLEAALAAHGLPRLGGARARGVPLAAAWLPLVIALARSPFDAESAVDLLLLPDNGLPRHHADRLARAMGDVPGLVGPKWVEALTRLATEHPDLAARLRTWLAPGRTPDRPGERLDMPALAERTALVDAVLGARVKSLRRAAGMRADDAAHPATADALEATREALGALVRALPTSGDIGAHQLDELVRTFGEVATHSVTRPEAGHLARVDDPAALTGPADTILWWGFQDPGRPARPLFRADERQALGLDAPIDLAARAADAARDVVSRAAQRLVLAYSAQVAGQPLAHHPLWSEIRGRMRSDDATRAVTVTPADLLASPRGGVRVEPRPAHAFAPAAPLWEGLEPLELPDPISVTALERLLRCPLQLVLDRLAGLRERAWGGLSNGPLLLGKLAHRLVEHLEATGQLIDVSDAVVAHEAAALIAREGTPLERPGRRARRRDAIERLVTLARRLRELLLARGLRVEASERTIVKKLGSRTLDGRIDLVLSDRTGAPVVLDIKWSTRRHRQAFEAGESFQLAAYAASFDVPTDGALFGVIDGQIVEGPGVLARTWDRVTQTLPALEARLAAGFIDVPGVDDAQPLGLAVGVVDGVAVERERACEYCRMDLVCGKRTGGDARD